MIGRKKGEMQEVILSRHHVYMNLEFRKELGFPVGGNLLSYVDFFHPALLLNSFITKMYFKCVVIFFCLILLNRQTSCLQKWPLISSLLHTNFVLVLLHWARYSEKMLTSSLSAYTWHFPLRVLNVHYSVGCIPWFLAENQLSHCIYYIRQWN